jgi:hypothetical protein
MTVFGLNQSATGWFKPESVRTGWVDRVVPSSKKTKNSDDYVV